MGEQSGRTDSSTNIISMAHNDPYAGIEFDDITESTGLAADEIKCLKTCFDPFDTKKVDFLSADDLGEIMRAMGFRPTEEELKELLLEIDEDGSGEIEFVSNLVSVINSLWTFIGQFLCSLFSPKWCFQLQNNCDFCHKKDVSQFFDTILVFCDIEFWSSFASIYRPILGSF